MPGRATAQDEALADALGRLDQWRRTHPYDLKRKDAEQALALLAAGPDQVTTSTRAGQIPHATIDNATDRTAPADPDGWTGQPRATSPVRYWDAAFRAGSRPSAAARGPEPPAALRPRLPGPLAPPCPCLDRGRGTAPPGGMVNGTGSGAGSAHAGRADTSSPRRTTHSGPSFVSAYGVVPDCLPRGTSPHCTPRAGVPPFRWKDLTGERKVGRA